MINKNVKLKLDFSKHYKHENSKPLSKLWPLSMLRKSIFNEGLHPDFHIDNWDNTYNVISNQLNEVLNKAQELTGLQLKALTIDVSMSKYHNTGHSDTIVGKKPSINLYLNSETSLNTQLDALKFSAARGVKHIMLNDSRSGIKLHEKGYEYQTAFTADQFAKMVTGSSNIGLDDNIGDGMTHPSTLRRKAALQKDTYKGIVLENIESAKLAASKGEEFNSYADYVKNRERYEKIGKGI